MKKFSDYGGKRAGAGKKKGTRWPSTLAKLAARERTRQLLTPHIPAMVEAQVAHATGIRHFMLRTKEGKFDKITSEEAVLAALNDPESVYEFWTKDPSTQAFTDLMNRAIDKPAEQPQELKLTGEVTLITRLHAARKRLADAKQKKP